MKHLALIFNVLVFGMFFGGCSLITEAIERDKREKRFCEMFENIDFEFIKNDGVIKGVHYETLDNMDLNIMNSGITEPEGKIINYDSGMVAKCDSFLCNYPDKSNAFHCPKIKILNTEYETKSFAVNGGGKNDFSVNVTKTMRSIDNKGKIDKIVSYKLEKLDVVRDGGFIYRADSLHAKKLKSDYAKIEKTFRNNLPCFILNRKTYCDGDLVFVYATERMLRVTEAGYGTVRYEIYTINQYTGEPLVEAPYEVMKRFRMVAPEVAGNYDLKKYEVKDGMLDLKEVKTFKAW